MSTLVLVAGRLVVGLVGGSPAAISVTFVVFALFRGPLWVVQGLLARVLPPLTRQAELGASRYLWSWNWRIGVDGTALAVLAALVGGWLGPWAVAGAFGAEFRPPAALTAAVCGGVAFVAAGLFTKPVPDRHGSHAVVGVELAGRRRRRAWSSHRPGSSADADRAGFRQRGGCRAALVPTTQFAAGRITMSAPHVRPGKATT